MLRLVVSCAGLAALVACGGGGSSGNPPDPDPGPVIGPAWGGFGNDAQHSGLSAVATQDLVRIAWQSPLDLAPQYSGSALLAHYGAPVITARNTVLLPLKGSAAGTFSIQARRGSDGALAWSLASDWRLPLPASSWVPSYNPVLTHDGHLALPAAAGQVLLRESPDLATGAVRRLRFYGNACDPDPAACSASIFINTPLTADANGGVFFGFSVVGNNPAGLVGGGFAHVAADGLGRHVLASVASGDAALAKAMTNSAPALSADGRTLYVVANSLPVAGQRQRGALLALDAQTLATLAAVPLLDPANGQPAWVSDNATSSPTVGPDGDVYIGVLESAAANHNFRGWLLHFDASLGTARLPASFGWDITASVVPASMVPAYSGGSPYLLAIKYNNYGGAGSGDGRNRMAIVDPRRAQADPINPLVSVMGEVLTVLGPTPDPGWAGGVKEWCVNTVAVDAATQSVLVNSEDGRLYRWHLPSNQLTQPTVLTSGLAEAYTPTAVGPDGRVYAVNNAVLFAVGR